MDSPCHVVLPDSGSIVRVPNASTNEISSVSLVWLVPSSSVLRSEPEAGGETDCPFSLATSASSSFTRAFNVWMCRLRISKSPVSRFVRPTVAP